MNNRSANKGYAKEPKQSLWGNSETAKIIMILLGGGSRIDEVSRLLKGEPVWDNIIGHTKEDETPDLEKC